MQQQLLDIALGTASMYAIVYTMAFGPLFVLGILLYLCEKRMHDQETLEN